MVHMTEKPRPFKYWEAPLAPHTLHKPLKATVRVPGSKSITNRALVLAAIAENPTTITGALWSRDTQLMAQALKRIGVDVQAEPDPDSPANATIFVEPTGFTGGTVDCGLAGTVMRFVPPLAALADGDVFFDGDEHARQRPMKGILDGLRALGISVQGDSLPFKVSGNGSPTGGTVEIDASASSQFVSGLLLAAPRFTQGITVRHIGETLPSMPHIEMTVHMLRQAGASVDTTTAYQWSVAPGPIRGGVVRVEPDLSNATPFLAAAAVTGSTVRVKDWPTTTTQPGDAIRNILERMGCTVSLTDSDLTVTGPKPGSLQGIEIDMSDIGELTPTVAAMATVANSPSTLTGIAHLHGHETDRLKALATEITKIGGQCSELPDGLAIKPSGSLHGAHWSTYDDHRMATTGAIIGLVTPGIKVENIETTAKTLPGFDRMWVDMVQEMGMS